MPATNKPGDKYVILIGVLVLVWLAISPRHSTEQSLQHHLDITDASAFRNVRTDFHSAREWTAHIYLEGNAADIRQLLDRQEFTSRKEVPSGVLARLSFSKAPSPPAAAQAQFFYRERNGIVDSAVVGPDGTQLWLVAQRF
jgi:hypothetical protein